LRKTIIKENNRKEKYLSFFTTENMSHDAAAPWPSKPQQCIEEKESDDEDRERTGTQKVNYEDGKLILFIHSH